jgi:hypothetical protein
VLSVVGSQSIADGQWHQLDVTYDGTGTAAGVIFYVDGHTIPQTVYSDTLNGAFAAAGAPMAIADTTGVAGADPNSLIDELSYFPTALSATKIQNHYAAATGNTRVDGRTLYAVVDRTETLTPRGNTTAASSHWGDYLTVYRRDVPASSTSPSADRLRHGGRRQHRPAMRDRHPELGRRAGRSLSIAGRRPAEHTTHQ